MDAKATALGIVTAWEKSGLDVLGQYDRMVPDIAAALDRVAADPEAVGDCWLVWALTAQGKVVLLAVDMVQSVADRHRRYALTPPNDYVRVYIERAKTNHLYGETIFNDRNPSRAGGGG